MRQINLIYVAANSATQSNKYYNLYEEGSEFRVEYGRVGSTKVVAKYPISKWDSIYRDKIKKGYKDITELKSIPSVSIEKSGNSCFDEFYDNFKKYSKTSVRSTYLVDGCTKQQLDAAQKILDTITKCTNISDVNDNLLSLYSIIPRRMANTRDWLIKDITDKNNVISREQNAIDSMDSNNIVITTNPLKELNIRFDTVLKDELVRLEQLIYPTTKNKYRIYKAYQIENNKRESFKTWMDTAKNKTTELLIHGTRNPNIFSILKSDLLIRPSNAAMISGAAYGNGIYHSAHTDKSLNYVGNDPDKIFFIQRVHVGNKYTYNGWYREGKDIGRHQMNYEYLSSNGYDSLYVKPGDGLLNSEYIVYRQEQTVTNYLIWLK